jgi:hypothetical protein
MTAAVAMVAAVVVESGVCCLGSARAIAAVAAAMVVAMIAVVTPVAIAVAQPAATAANVKWFAASCPNERFAAAFGFRLAKPAKSNAPGIAASAFASKSLILAAAPSAYLAPKKCNAA